MTNRKILRKYVCGLLNQLRHSPEQVDKEIYKYLSKRFVKITGVDEAVRSMGESPLVHWKHNVHPDRMKALVVEGNKRKSEPGFARRTILKHVIA